MKKNSRVIFLSLLAVLIHVVGMGGNARALEYHATFGSVFHITSASAGLPDGFKAKPKVFVIRNGSYVRPIEVLGDDDYFQDNPANGISCQVKTPLMGGTYSLWLQPTDYGANPQPYIPTLITDRFIVEKPVIESVLLSENGGIPEATLIGRFFGAAGIWIHLSNPAGTNSIPCSIEWPYRFADAASRPGTSCMNPQSGLSELSFILPATGLEPGEYAIRLSNPTGIDAFGVLRLKQSKEELDVVLAVNPSPLAASTTPEPGLEFKVNSGESIRISAAPSPNFTFGGWTAEGDVEFEDAAALQTQATIYGSAEIIAHCTANPTLTMKVAHAGRGTTTPLPDQTIIIPPGESAEISASAFSGWNFAGWIASENASLSDNMALTTRVTLTGDAEVTADFVETGVSGVQFSGLVSAESDTYEDEGEVKSFVWLTWAQAICVDTAKEDVRYLIYIGESNSVEELFQEPNLASSVTGNLSAKVQVQTGPVVLYALAVAVDKQGNTSIPGQPLKISVGEQMIYKGKLVNLLHLVGADNYHLSEDEEIVTLKGDYWGAVSYGDIVVVALSGLPTTKIRKVRLIYLDENNDTVIWLEDGSLSDVIESGEISGSLFMNSSLKNSLSQTEPGKNSNNAAWDVRGAQMANHRVYKHPENRFLLMDRPSDRSGTPLEENPLEENPRSVIHISPNITLKYSVNIPDAKFNYSIPFQNGTMTHFSLNGKMAYSIQGELIIDTTGDYEFEKKGIMIDESTIIAEFPKEAQNIRALSKYLDYYLLMNIKYKGRSNLKIVERIDMVGNLEINAAWDYQNGWRIHPVIDKNDKFQFNAKGDFLGKLEMDISTKVRFGLSSGLKCRAWMNNSMLASATVNSNYLGELNYSGFTVWKGQKINVLTSAIDIVPFLQPYTYTPPDKWEKAFSLPSLGSIPPYGAYDGNLSYDKNIVNQRPQIWEDGVNNPILGSKWNWYKESDEKWVETEVDRGQPSLYFRRIRRYPAVEPNPYELWILAIYWGLGFPEVDWEKPHQCDDYYLRARPRCPRSPFPTEKWWRVRYCEND